VAKKQNPFQTSPRPASETEVGATLADDRRLRQDGAVLQSTICHRIAALRIFSERRRADGRPALGQVALKNGNVRAA